MGLPAYDAARIHHARVSAADVHAVTRGLLAQTRAARGGDRRDAPGPGRRDRRRRARPRPDHGAVRLRRGAGERARHPRRDRLVAGRRTRAAEGQVAADEDRGSAGPAGRLAVRSGRPGYAGRAQRRRRSRSWPAAAATLDELIARQSVCRACPRLVAWREQVAVRSAAARSATSATGAAPFPAGDRRGRAC